MFDDFRMFIKSLGLAYLPYCCYLKVIYNFSLTDCFSHKGVKTIVIKCKYLPNCCLIRTTRNVCLNTGKVEKNILKMLKAGFLRVILANEQTL